jgi:hypothetical protein
MGTNMMSGSRPSRYGSTTLDRRPEQEEERGRERDGGTREDPEGEREALILQA